MHGQAGVEYSNIWPLPTYRLVTVGFLLYRARLPVSPAILSKISCRWGQARCQAVALECWPVVLSWNLHLKDPRDKQPPQSSH